MQKIISFCALIIMSHCLFGQGGATFDWANHFTGSISNKERVEGKAIVCDQAGNIYTAGHFSGVIDFDPTKGVYELNSAIQGNLFVTKMDMQGRFIWAKNLGSGKMATMALDNRNNIIIAGTFDTTSDFDPDGGIYNLPSQRQSLFVAKLNNSGNFVWAKAFSCIPADTFPQAINFGIVTDDTGNVYTTGGFRGTYDFDPGSGTCVYWKGMIKGHIYQGWDPYISKLDSNGGFVWAKRFSNDHHMKGFGAAIKLDSKGNVYSTGIYSGNVDFDPGPGTSVLYSVSRSSTGTETYISKLANNGDFIWVKRFTCDDYNNVHAFDIDSFDNLYFAGSYLGTTDLDPGRAPVAYVNYDFPELYVVKLDSSANFLWAKTFLNLSKQPYKQRLVTDKKGNVFVSCTFRRWIDLDPDSIDIVGTDTIGNWDVYLLKLNTNGEFLYRKVLGGKKIDSISSISVDGRGGIFGIGTFMDTVDFDPGAGIYRLSSVSMVSTFYYKFADDKVLSIDIGTKDSGVKIYPNPTENILTIEIPQTGNDVKIDILNMLGQKVVSQSLKTNISFLDLGRFSPGIYLIQITERGEVLYSGKVLKK